jgi:hypothetical protein
MNLAEYNALTGDTKLAAALAIACGWRQVKAFGLHEIRVAYDEDFVREGVRFISWYRFEPFADASIPYGLPISCVGGTHTLLGSYVASYCDQPNVINKSKTHAIVQEYIAADPMGHLNKFLSTKE